VKVLIAGNKIRLGPMLNVYGVETLTVPHVPLCPWRDHDIHAFAPDISLIFGIWRWHWILRTQFLPGTKIYRVQGTDAYTLDAKTRWLLKHLKTPLLYAAKHLQDLVQLPGDTIPTPINTLHFKNYHQPRTKDVLYYCPSDQGTAQTTIYEMHRLIHYMEQYPKLSVTILNGTTPYKMMPDVYNDHHTYLRWTTHDAHPKMPYEALACGCDVYVNDEQVTEIPDFMRMEHTIPRWIEYFHHIMSE
jgi:hypothetical protein